MGVLSQRLVRVLCPECKAVHVADTTEREFLGPDADAVIYQPNGCDACAHTGYKGRTGIYELVVVDDGLRQLIHDQASEQTMVDHVRSDAPTIQEDGRQKVLAGDTTIQEILRVTLED